MSASTEPSVTIYRDSADGWRWRFISSNGRVLADSGQGYARKRACVRGLEIVTGTTYRQEYRRGAYCQGRLILDNGLGYVLSSVFVEVLP